MIHNVLYYTINNNKVKKIYSFNVSDESKKELQIISSLYLNKNLDKDYKFEKLF